MPAPKCPLATSGTSPRAAVAAALPSSESPSSDSGRHCLKIVHVIPGLTWDRGGPTAVLCALSRMQAEAGHQVRILTTDQGARHGERPADVAPGVRVGRLNVWGSDRIAFSPGFARAVSRELRDCDVIHVHSIFTYPVHAAFGAALEAKVPLILRPCGQLHRYSLGRSALRKRTYLALWGRRVRRACTALHFTSAEEARSSWPWDSSPKFVVPNGVEPGDFSLDRSEARRRVWRSYPALGEAPYVLFLGRLHAKKRLDILLEAFLDAAPAPTKLVIAGPDEGSLWNTLSARYLSTNDTRRRVIRVETVTGPDKAALLAGASLFALSSEHENFGVAALEALAAGTAVLLSPHVDLAESVLAEQLGWTAELTVAAWGEHLARLLRDEGRLSEIARRAPPWVEENYSWRRISQQLEREYRRVMAAFPRNP